MNNMHKTTELNTERLLLRPFAASDSEALYAYAKNPNVGPNAGWKPHASQKESTTILKELFLNRREIWAIVMKKENLLIGSIGLHSDNKRTLPDIRMVGYSLGEPYWGQGYVTEAVKAVLGYGFGPMMLELISAYCYPDNAGSQRVLEKCGFHREGIIKRAEMLFDGQIRDHLCFSLSRRNFFTAD